MRHRYESGDLQSALKQARWSASNSFKRGDRVLGSNGRWFVSECTGRTSEFEPHWSEMEGSTRLDGTIVWKCEGFPHKDPPQWSLDLAPKAPPVEPPMWEEREV